VSLPPWRLNSLPCQPRALVDNCYPSPHCCSDVDDTLEEISSLPGQRRIGLNHLVKVLTPIVNDGLQSVLLFGVITQLPKVWAY